MNARRLPLAILATMLGAMVFATATAVAAEKYVFSATLSSGEDISEADSVAVNESTGNVYVVGETLKDVAQFEASGKPDTTTPLLTGAIFESPAAVVVDNSGLASKGDIYVADFGGVVDQFDPAGAATAVRITEASIPDVDQGNGGFEPTGVAVSSGGDLFVADFSNGVVDEFSPSGTFIAQIGSAAEINRPHTLAIDSTDNLYVASGQGVVEFDSSGRCVDGCAPIDAAGDRGVAVDGAGDVFVGEETQVSEYNASRTLIERMIGGHSVVPAFGGLDSARGLAVNDITDALYVADNFAGAVDVFSPATVPDVSTGSSTKLTPGEVALNGTVNPEGMAVISCEFEYGSSTAYGQAVPCVPEADSIPVDSSEHAVSANLTGLAPGEYHYRLVAGNAHGENQGEDGAFSVAYKPAIEEVSFSNVSSSAATVSAQIDPGEH